LAINRGLRRLLRASGWRHGNSGGTSRPSLRFPHASSPGLAPPHTAGLFFILRPESGPAGGCLGPTRPPAAELLARCAKRTAAGGSVARARRGTMVRVAPSRDTLELLRASLFVTSPRPQRRGFSFLARATHQPCITNSLVSRALSWHPGHEASLDLSRPASKKRGAFFVL
jgi:hypothetical protein